MKRTCIAILLAIGLAFPVVVAEAGTWTGEVVAMKCKLPDSDRPAHEHCAARCVKGGQPMGLLTDDGTLVLLKKSPEKPAPYGRLREGIGRRHSVSGALAERDGMKVVTVTGSKAAS